MVDELRCPNCSGTQIGREQRRRNPKTGYTIGTWYLGCLFQLTLLVAVISLVGFFVTARWPANPFAEAAVLIAILSAIFLVVMLGLVIWLWRWPAFHEFTCQNCGHKWSVDLLGSTGQTPIQGAEKGNPAV